MKLKLLKNKIGQMNQVFIFLMAIFVIGLIVFVASKSMGQLISGKCDVDSISFKQNIQSEIVENNAYGSVNEIKLPVPCKYTTLCIVDPDALITSDSYGIGETILSTKMPGAFVIRNSIKNNVRTNIFLISSSDGLVEEVGYVPQVKLDVVSGNPPSYILCVNASAGYFKIRTQGLGKFTKLKATN